MERDRRNAIIILALLSPILGEVVSGSSPPLELILNPISFPLLIGLYGSGALLVRELSIIWKKGWFGIVVLGFAYGIIEEGLAVKSFFDPGWMDLGAMAVFGRWLGVNWAWAVWLTLYHSLVSITIPIFLFETVRPDWRDKRLLGPRSFKVVSCIMLVVVVLCFFALTSYRPPAGLYLGAIATVIVIGYIAWKANAGIILAKTLTPLFNPRLFYFLGAVFMFMTFILAFAVPSFDIPPVLMILVLIMLWVAVLYFLIICIGTRENEFHRLSFVAGVMTPFVVFDFILEINGIRGMALVGLFFVVFLWFIADRTNKRISLL